MIDTVDFEDEAFSDFECFEEYELGADPLDVAMESALLDDDDEEPEDGCDEEPDLGDQSFEDFMDAFDFEDPSDECEQGDGVSVWDEEVDND